MRKYKQQTKAICFRTWWKASVFQKGSISMLSLLLSLFHTHISHTYHIHTYTPYVHTVDTPHTYTHIYISHRYTHIPQLEAVITVLDQRSRHRVASSLTTSIFSSFSVCLGQLTGLPPGEHAASILPARKFKWRGNSRTAALPEWWLTSDLITEKSQQKTN